MSDKSYYLVMYEEGKSKGVIHAYKKVLNEYQTKIILQDAANPTLTIKENGSKYLLTNKRLFEYINTDGTTTLFIICDGVKQKS
jgi:hypothetical protein